MKKMTLHMEYRTKSLWNIVVTGLFICFGAYSYGQDFHLTQEFESPLTLNPATAGMQTQALRAHLQQRTQWRQVATKPYLTEVLSYDQPYGGFGVGAYIMNNTAGAGRLNEFHFLPNIAYMITERNDQYHISTGVQFGFIHKSLNMDRLSFEDQYNPLTGTFEETWSNNEPVIQTSETLFDLNFGAHFYTMETLAPFKKKTAGASAFPLYAGLSAFHLTQPKEKFLGGDGVLYRKWVGYAGGLYKFHEDFGVEANVMYMRQAKNNDLVMSAIVYYKMQRNSDQYFLMLGPQFRWKDAAIVFLGCVYEDFRVGLTYDINVSKLKYYSRYRGGFEFSVTYTRPTKAIASFFNPIF